MRQSHLNIQMSKVIGVFGNRGGGTSAVAGVVKLLGFKMWGKERTIDDNELYTTFQKNTHLIDKVLAERNSHGSWAFKHPFLTPHLKTLRTKIPNLKCIYVFRDPVATAEHGSGEYQLRLKEDIDFMNFMLNDPDGLYLSYERITRHRAKAVHQIAEYLEVDVNPRAIDWLDPRLKYRLIADYE